MAHAESGRGLTAVRAERRRRARRRKVLAITTVVTLAFALALVATVGLRRAPPPRPAPDGPAQNARALFALPPVIAIRGDAVFIDDVRVDSTAAIDESQRLSRLEGLFEALKARRHAAAGSSELGRFAVIHVDHDVSAIVVKSVFQTTAYAGYTDVKFGAQAQTAPSAGE